MTVARRILLVEDNDHDAELISMALVNGAEGITVDRVCDGVEALEYLHEKSGAGAEARGLPSLVLLDIKMPRMNGIELLKWIKGDPVLKVLPVVMLTSSREERDIQECYDFGSNAYVVKPLEFKQLLDSLDSIGRFWTVVNITP
ncbi:MAG: response regulator [Spirochaetes bacterium]|nr:response regulator [Spirochaetota bacterium]